MKTLELKKGEITARTNEGEKTMSTDYGDLILTALDQAPKEGFTISSIKERKRISDAIDDAKKTLTEPKLLFLEDADFGILKASMNNAKWAVRAPFIIQMYDDIEEAGKQPTLTAK